MHVQRLFSLFLLTSSLSVVSHAQNASSSVHPTTLPSVIAMRRSGPIIVDGRLDEAAWQAAQPVLAVPAVLGAAHARQTDLRQGRRHHQLQPGDINLYHRPRRSWPGCAVHRGQSRLHLSVAPRQCSHAMGVSSRIDCIPRVDAGAQRLGRHRHARPPQSVERPLPRPARQHSFC